MKEIIRTNNPALISFVEALFKQAGVAYLVTDQNMSIIALPKRILVDTEHYHEARDLLLDARLDDELRPKE